VGRGRDGVSDALRRLLALTQSEHLLAANGPAEDLAGVQDELAVALSELPPALDAGDHALLVQAFQLRERTIELLRAARDEAASEVAKLDHGRSAVRGYTPAGMGAPTPSVDHAA